MQSIDIEFSDALEDLTKVYIHKSDPYTMIATLSAMAGIVAACCENIDIDSLRPIIKQASQDGFEMAKGRIK